MTETKTLQPRLLKPGAGPTLLFQGMRLAYKVSSQETDGKWSLLEYLVPPMFEGPAPHWHELTDEVFYVLDGNLIFRLGDALWMAESDGLVYIPRGTLHTFSNPSEKPVRFLLFAVPGGQDEYLKELAARTQFEKAWPAHGRSEFDALHERYDTYEE